MIRRILFASALLAVMVPAFAQTTQPPTTNGQGLGNNNPAGPPGFVNQHAQAPQWSTPGLPSQPGVSGPIVGGGVSGPNGATWAGSVNNPGNSSGAHQANH